ncbi:probable crossover junction endonuclease EME2 isoform X2 [Hippocampus zosterae]|uniref:probable crossover junction endonuclease EME2 isoform X2 n=1 Tax=Hippocampus zosterae TaxID=109293 RepID=UPI00223CD919|nr:probable crossover junction endonuclease EME2 isoform X2 [Hippocampus zosterae]
MSRTWEISDSDAEVEKESNGTLQSRERSGDSAERSVSVPPPSFERDRPGPAKRRRSKEEMEADRDKARQRREAREKNRAAKERQKQEKKKEQEKRKEAAQRLKPENCLQCLTVCVDPALLQQPGCDILLGTLSSLEWRYSIRPQPLANGITWTRDLPQLTDGATGTVAEDQLVQVLSASQFVDVAVAVKKLIDSDGEELEGDSVPGPLAEGFRPDAGQVATILVTEYRGPAFAQAVRSRSGGGDVDVEELRKNVAVFFVESWRDVADHVCAVTKSLSKRPLKQLTERARLPFCAEGSWAGGARVEKDGSGLRRVWSEQIRQLNRVGGATASCVTAAYPSPRLLLQAYGAARSEEERKKLLAHLEVKGDGQDRRVGPQISARVYRCLTARNPELVLD